MTFWKSVVLSTIVFAAFSFVRPAHSQVSVGVNIGVAPVCPYGYFDYAPYNCAPYGYYGPDWFVGGVFIGAGPWFHGPAGFHGHVVKAPSHAGTEEHALPGFHGGGRR